MGRCPGGRRGGVDEGLSPVGRVPGRPGDGGLARSGGSGSALSASVGVRSALVGFRAALVGARAAMGVRSSLG